MSAGRRELRYLEVVALAAVLIGIFQPVRAAETPEAVARTLYSAFDRHDSPAINALLAPDVRWVFSGRSDEIPYAGSYRGPLGVAEFFRLVSDSVRVDHLQATSYVTQGDTVLVRGSESGVVLTTDGRYEANWLHAITVTQGRITRFEELTDTAALVDAFAPADTARGKAYFTTCAGCHGTGAQGNRDMNAPNLSGIDGVYLLRQLRHFASGMRGGASNFYGWQMNGRSSALPGDRALRDVTAYVSSRDLQRPLPSMTGNAVRGARFYVACAACHGEHAEGDASRGVPALAPLDDWYQVRQLRDFKSGARGNSSADPQGLQMRAAAAALPDDRAIIDVVAYVNQLTQTSSRIGT